MHSEWEVPQALLGIKGLRSMYHSVDMSYVLISTDGESEDLKPVEKALRSEEVTILSKFVFISGYKIIGGSQWMRQLVWGFFATSLGG